MNVGVGGGNAFRGRTVVEVSRLVGNAPEIGVGFLFFKPALAILFVSPPGEGLVVGMYSDGLTSSETRSVGSRSRRLPRLTPHQRSRTAARWRPERQRRTRPARNLVLASRVDQEYRYLSSLLHIRSPKGTHRPTCYIHSYMGLRLRLCRSPLVVIGKPVEEHGWDENPG